MKTSALISAAIKLALGILFVILKAEVVGICITILGITLLVMGIIDIVHNDITSGIIKIVLAAAVTLIGWLLIEIALIVLGAVILVSSILDITKIVMNAVENKWTNIVAAIFALIEPTLALIASLFLITSRGAAIEWTIVIAGIVLIINGIIAILQEFIPKNSVKSYEIEVEYTDKTE